MITIVIPIGHSAVRFPSLVKHLNVLSHTLNGYVHEIIFSWNTSVTPPTEVELVLPYRVILNDDFSLNNRFKPLDISTEAVLHLDDDVRPSADQIRATFEKWKEDPTKLIACETRTLYAFDDLIIYDFQNAKDNAFIGLTPFLMMSVSYMKKYWSNSQESLVIRQLVDEMMNCEDLGMNFLVAQGQKEVPLTTLPFTILIDKDTQAMAISKKTGHLLNRTIFLNTLFLMFGMPICWQPQPVAEEENIAEIVKHADNVRKTVKARIELGFTLGNL